jgi:hypothetical protein
VRCRNREEKEISEEWREKRSPHPFMEDLVIKYQGHSSFWHHSEQNFVGLSNKFSRIFVSE